MYISDINLNLYKTFYEVAKSGSISAASRHLYVSQPATSRAIKKLEEQLNITLFYRTLNGMELTRKGKELLFYIEEAYNSLIIGEKNVREDDLLTTGRLSIGVPSHIGRFFLFDKMAEFHKVYPNVQISIISRSSNELMTLLENHEIDFAIDTSPIDTTYANLNIIPVAKVRHCFFCKNNSNINGIKKIKKLSDLNEMPLILPVSRSFHRKELNKIALENNCEFSNVLSIETSEMIVTAVKRDMGIGYVLRDFVEADIASGEFTEINVKEKLPEIGINLLYIDKYLTRVPQKYIKEFINVKI